MCERLFSDRKGQNSLFTNEEKLELAESFQPPLLLQPPPPSIIRT